MGPMTGRAAGYCAGYSMPGFANPVPGRGLAFGRGRGFGRGLGLGFRGGRGWGAACAAPYPAGALYGAPAAPYAAGPTEQQEIDALNEQSAYLEQALDAVRKRLGELEADKNE